MLENFALLHLKLNNEIRVRSELLKTKVWGPNWNQIKLQDQIVTIETLRHWIKLHVTKFVAKSISNYKNTVKKVNNTHYFCIWAFWSGNWIILSAAPFPVGWQRAIKLPSIAIIGVCMPAWSTRSTTRRWYIGVAWSSRWIFIPIRRTPRYWISGTVLYSSSSASGRRQLNLPTIISPRTDLGISRNCPKRKNTTMKNNASERLQNQSRSFI